MKRSNAPGIAFIVIGIVFITIGSSGQRGLIAVGAAFVAIGLVAVIRQRRGAGPE